MSFETVATSVLGSLASKVVTSVLGMDEPSPPPQQAAVPAPTSITVETAAAAPQVAPVTPMETPPAAGSTTPRSAAQRAAQRASIAQQLKRRGRASTILSDPGLTADASLGA